MMELNRASTILFFFLLMGLSASASASASASTFISDGVFESHASSSGRNLLQAKKACPVNFEFLNYTIITSRCKAPKYPPHQCCAAFKEFACPYVDQINDLTNDCASTMFSYINLYGKYPPGLFASECLEGKLGLECPASSPSTSASSPSASISPSTSAMILPSTSASSPSTSANESRSQLIRNQSSLLMAAAGFLVLLIKLL